MDEPPRRRGTSNPDRPRLPEEDEKELLPVDELKARAYTAMEDHRERVRALLEAGVVEEVIEGATDTAVHRIAEVVIPRAPTEREKP